MKKRTPKRLQLHRETVQTLGARLARAVGGGNTHEFQTGCACTDGCGSGGGCSGGCGTAQGCQTNGCPGLTHEFLSGCATNC